MTGRRRHRRHTKRRVGRAVYLRLRAEAWRVAVAFLFCTAMIIVVLKASAPYAIAPIYPELALVLNRDNPEALLAKAGRLNEQLLAVMEAEGEMSGKTGSALAARGGTIARLPKAPGEDLETSVAVRDSLREQIRTLAARAIANDPFNATAYRILAESTADPDRMHFLMLESVKRSRHETEALFYLLNEAFYRRDHRTVLRYANILIRTRPDLAQYILHYITLAGEDPEGMPLVVEQLARGPSWRRQFFEALPWNARRSDTPMKLMTALAVSDKPVSPKELAPYLDALIANNQTDSAYNAWLRFLPKSDLDHIGLLTNGDFARAPSGLPFDWRLSPGLNATAEFVRVGADTSERALFVRFGTGRVKFPELSQIVLLPPGRYRLEGKLRGRIVSKRGLRWQLRCASPQSDLLGETEMLTGESVQWRVFALTADVPERADCIGQTVRLIHDSRSASEELISGEVWLAGLQLERVRPETAPVEDRFALQKAAAP